MHRPCPSLVASLSAALLAAAASLVGAAVIHVPAGQPTIQAGIDAAVSGDTVLVAPDTYFEHDLDYGGRDIAVIGTAGETMTIVDAGSLGSGVVFDSEETAAALLEGFTIRNGSPNAVRIVDAAPTIRACTLTASQMDGLWIEDATVVGGTLVDPLIDDCDVVNNGGSGAICFAPHNADEFVRAHFAGCQLDDNAGRGLFLQDKTWISAESTSFAGNGMRGIEINGENAQGTFDWCTISNNEHGGILTVNFAGGTFDDCTISDHDTDGNGAGLRENLAEADNAFNRCTFARNHAGGDGGAAFVSNQQFQLTEFNACTFVDNSATSGGAIRWSSGVMAPMSIDGCTFVRNTATDRGGALLVSTEPGVPLISHCVFWENQASLGGAVYCVGEVPFGNRIEFWFCTMVGNHATEGAAAFVERRFVEQASAAVRNTIVAFSPEGEPFATHDHETPPGATTVSALCSDVFGNADGDWVGLLDGQGGIFDNISQDAQFCDEASGDFTLAATSPCAAENSGCGELIGALPVACGSVGIVDLGAPAADRRLIVRPNPVATHAIFSLGAGPTSAASVLEIYSPAGRLVERIRTRGDVHWSPAPGAPRGVYLARLVGDAGVEAQTKFLLVP